MSTTLDESHNRANGWHFYVPENFDAAATLPPHLSRYTDCANYLVSRILAGRVFGRADADGFVNLIVRHLRRVIPDRVERDIRQAMIDGGVIECDKHYINGDKAMGYRLTPQFRTASRRVECKDRRVKGRIAELNKEFRTDVKLPVHKYLRDWLCDLNIDVLRAYDVIRDTPRLAADTDLHMTTARMVADKHFEFSHCEHGRVHTNITRLARELRSTLSIGGEHLVSVDITNCQPLILSLLLSDTHSRAEKREARGTLPSIMMSIHSSPYVEYVVDTGLASEQAREYREYQNLCESGTFYEHLAGVAGLNGMTRDDVKVRLFTDVFYGRNRAVTDVTRLFGKAFPNVLGVIRQVKRKDHTRLACLMQTYESDIIIHGACRSLMQNPDVPVITIHDSILTTPRYVDVVRRAMADAFLACGLRPKFKVESEDVRRRAAA